MFPEKYTSTPKGPIMCRITLNYASLQSRPLSAFYTINKRRLNLNSACPRFDSQRRVALTLKSETLMSGAAVGLW